MLHTNQKTVATIVVIFLLAISTARATGNVSAEAAKPHLVHRLRLDGA